MRLKGSWQYMRIRTKLLLLLLAISVLPLLALGGIRVHSSLELGKDLAKRQTSTLIEHPDDCHR